MLKEKRESEGRGGGSLTLSFPPTSPRGRQDRIESERTSVKKRERAEGASEQASEEWLLLLRPRHYLRAINSQNFPLESCSRLGSSPLYPS